MKKKEDELLNSNYDGIQEYDNDLPRWWKALFLITIIFGAVYAVYYYSLSSEDVLKEQLAGIKKQQAAAPVHELSAATLLALVKNPEKLANGKENFVAKCSPCHGPEGQGVIGPNLTDDHWINGGAITDIRRIIEVGVADKGMVPWKGLLTPSEMDNLSAYIYTLHGTNPANPKAPQGEMVPRS